LSLRGVPSWAAPVVITGVAAAIPVSLLFGWRFGMTILLAIWIVVPMLISIGRGYHSAAFRDSDITAEIANLGDGELRGRAAIALGANRAHTAVPALLRSLDSTDDGDRILVIKALWEIGDDAALPELTRIARQDEAVGVRVTAIDALASLGDRDGRKMLARLALDPDSVLTGASRYANHVPAWARFLGVGVNRQTRRWAAKRLVKLRATEVLPVLTQSPRPDVGLIHALRLWWTVRALRSLDGSHD
jgi:hypothetical protein